MRAGNNKTDPQEAPQTSAYSAVGQWLKREATRVSNLKTVGDSDKVSPQHEALVNALGRVLDEHDKLLKYCRLVVLRHDKEGFGDNVNAIRNYLVEDLDIQP